MTESKTYQGQWWIPSDNEVTDQVYFDGTLKINEDNSCLLSLLAAPSGNDPFMEFDVLWGKDKHGNLFSIFKSEITKWFVSDHLELKAKYVIIGTHIKSLDEPYFSECYVEFPYLEDWTNSSMACIPQDFDRQEFTIKYGLDKEYLKGELENGLQYKIVDRTVCHLDHKKFSAWKETQYQIISNKPLSIKALNQYIKEFSQFFSLAMYSKQQPSEIYYRKQEEEKIYKLYFVASPSKKPTVAPLLPLWDMRERLPLFIGKFHSVHEKIETLTRYLITSINTGDFDAPIFIVVAQALEGYYQRFLKGKKGISNRKWEALIKQYENIKAIKDCNIDADVLKDTRDRYSHLALDGTPEYPNAAKGSDLLMLTIKCKILLTCCILKQIGMTDDEINTCFDQSIVHFMVHTVKKYEKKKSVDNTMEINS